MTEAIEKAWTKIFVSMNHETRPTLGRAGFIPVFDGSEWRVFRNSITISLGAENCADPAKVDVLRQNVVNLLDHYPDTIKQLEKLGLRVKALLNKEIRTSDDVVAWADSFFNLGPSTKRPPRIQDIIDIAYDDIVIEVKGGRDPVYVIPVAPRGSGVAETIDYSRWFGPMKRYGPRHEYTKLAFTKQIPKKIKTPRYRGKTVEGEPQRPRGRPRNDGLVPGSPEARKADRKKAREKEARRAARQKNGDSKITRLRPVRRPLARVGQRKQQATGA